MFSATFKKNNKAVSLSLETQALLRGAVTQYRCGVWPHTLHGPTVGTCNPYLSQESMCCNIFMFDHIYSVLTVENVLCVEAQRLLPVVKPLSAFFLFFVLVDYNV